MTEIDHSNGSPPQEKEASQPAVVRRSESGPMAQSSSVSDTRAVSGTAGEPFLSHRIRTMIVPSLMLILLGSCAGFVGALLWPPTYAARADILFADTAEQSSTLRQSLDLTTQLVRLRSREVLGPVAARYHTPVEEFEKNVSVSVVDSSEIVQVEVRNHSRDAAVGQDKDIVDRYMQVAGYRQTSAGSRYLRGELDRTAADLGKARAEAQMWRQDQGTAPPPSPADVASNEARVQSLTSRQQQILSQLDQVNVSQLSKAAPQVVVAPYLVRDPVSPRPGYAAAGGALTAVLIAAGVVPLIARRRNRRLADEQRLSSE